LSSKGLQNISAGDTSLCLMGEGVNALYYLGYDATSLATHHSFELVCYLLTRRMFPSEKELKQYQQRIISLSEIPAELASLVKTFPETADPMDILRTSVSYLGILQPEKDTHDHYFIVDQLIALMPRIIGLWRGVKISQDDSLALAACKACCDTTINDAMISAMNASLILYAEHEFNASTFAARVTSATLSDIYSAICSAIGTLRGPLHGGANREALKLIKEFETVESVEEGIHAKLKKGEKLMGFGHRVYKTSDPRSIYLKQLLEKDFQCEQLKVAMQIEATILKEKNIISNVDFYTAVLYDQMSIPENLFVSIFVMGRITGWLAHILEQRADNRLIRPDANYIGEEPRPLEW